MSRHVSSTESATSETSGVDADGDDLHIWSAAQRGLVALVVLVGCTLTLGGLGSLLVFDSAFGEFESDVVRWMADNRNAAFDAAAKVGAVTDTWTAIGVMFGAMTILVAVDRGRLAAFILVAMALELATFLIVGAIVDRPRPETDSLGAVPSTPSFPSGHAAGTVALYGSLMFAARRVASPDRVGRVFALTLPVVLAVLVAASRVYDGIHYPTDVVAGLLMGAGAFVGALYVMDLVADFREEMSGTSPIGGGR